METKTVVSERGLYPNHKERYWEFSNTKNRREIVRQYSKIKYTEDQARRIFENLIYSYPSK